MNDIYATPEADLHRHQSERMGGNIEDALAGNIRIGVTDTLGDAWRSVAGFKLPSHLALLIYFVLAVVASLISIPIFIGMNAIGVDPSVTGAVSWVAQMAASIAIMPMFFGVHIMGIRHLADKSVSSATIFQYFNKIPRLFLCYFLMTVLIMLGLLLLVLPGIYLMVAYMYAMPLIVEKDMPAWQALETSRRIITKNWFQLFGILLILMLLNVLGILTLGIAWLWTVPWSVLAMALVHVKLFGAEPQTLAD